MEDRITTLRQERRKKQIERARRQRRNAVMALLCAAVVIALCAGLIYSLKHPGEDSPSAENLTVSSQPETAETETQETEPVIEPETVITIAALGDLNVTDKVIEAGGAGMDFSDLFLDVLPVISRADWTLLNLEGTVGSAPYGGESQTAPASLLTALRRAGVDMVQLANSYSIAQGLTGMNNTLQSVRTAGLEPVGLFESSQEFQKTGGYTLMDIRGVKVAFVAFTKGMDGMGLPAGSEDCVNLLYTDYASTYSKIDYDGISAVMKNVRAGNPDVVIALVHWGSEYNDQISQSQKDLESYLRENGANAIIGTHSHYVQEMKFDPETGAFTAYCLGDFVGDGSHAGTEYSVVLELEITKDNRTGQTKITGYDYTPICVVEEAGKLRIRRLSQILYAYENSYIDRVTEEKYQNFVYDKTRVEERIHPEAE
ncbi:MAG: CapA family protein [Firmicutes bacterium]|nr:CapA family protein [Bacillota bacterium]